MSEFDGGQGPPATPEPAAHRRGQLQALVLSIPLGLTLSDPVKLYLEHRQENLAGYLSRVWPDQLTSTLYASNIGNDPQAPEHLRDLLLRPASEGPHTSEWAVGGMTLGFQAYRKQGKLQVRRIELTPHVPARHFEMRVTAPVRWQYVDQVFMSAWDFEVLGHLPFHRAETRERLQEWRRYLEWKEALIHKNQIVVPYAAWRWEDEDRTVIAFLMHERDRPDRKLAGLELGTRETPPEPEPERDGSSGTRRKRRAREPRIRTLGEVEWAGRLDLRDAWDTNWGELKVTRHHGKVCIRLDEETAERLKPDDVPSMGELVSSIAGDIAPVRNQQGGVNRLNHSQGFSPRLADFIFSSARAGLPRTPINLDPIPGGRDLNPGQRDAVTKALSAPDLCLVQGPPGTGKTTVIADICLRATRDGQRVLVASQTNLAVDNALARLAEVPWVRPLRLGNPDRVDEEFKDFLADHVIDRWFGSIADHCRARMRDQAGAEERIRAWELAAEDMKRAWDTWKGVTERARRTSEAASSAQEAHEAAVDASARLSGQTDAARDQLDRLRALVSWAEGDRPLPPDATSTPWPQIPLPSGLGRGHVMEALDRTRARGVHLDAVIDALDRASAGGASDPAAAAELKALRAEKLSLIDSDTTEDMNRLRLVNRKIKDLKGTGWTAITTELHRAALRAWPDDRPSSLSEVVDALTPTPEVMGHVTDAREVAEAQRALQRAAADAIAAAGAHWATTDLATRDALDALVGQWKEAAGRLDTTKAERDRTFIQDEAATQSVDAATREWTEAWSRLGTAGAPPEPSLEAVLAARLRAAEARESQAARLARASRWRDVQSEWVDRLGRVTASDREHLQSLYVRHSNVVGMTCNEAGKRKTWQDPDFRPFDIVIVDEVSKATPPELILPLLLGRKAVLVGDHRQLPPMFRERDATFGDAAEEGEVTKEEFERFKHMVTSSLFQELFEEAPPEIKAMLWTQYRMHPQIMDAANEFYEGRLEAGPSRTALADARAHRLAVEDEHAVRIIRPSDHLLWIDSSAGPMGDPCWEDQVGSSKANALEVDVIASALVRIGAALRELGYGPTVTRTLGPSPPATWRLAVSDAVPEIDPETLEELFRERRVRVGGRAQHADGAAHAGAEVELRRQKEVGVLTFYGAQLRALRKEIARRRPKHRDFFATMELRTNTVDRFQGMEKPIVLVSLVRAKRGKLGGFVREYQRINVGLSRAQQLLVIVGAEQTWTRAEVPLPPLDGGVTHDEAVYRNILERARQTGGRRLARQFLLR